ncbi:hypothetical protein RCL_jg13918.t1 [Rhizophagus clarus]|uniref:Uncharacterized protein n=1 Tax=Rhizophagus clarus TaxID=94130 RepID=A0A8H3QUA0_9GLOM|nr:hypothetical protein RCL_jg13918.t1 [Rhizophagus clarus]
MEVQDLYLMEKNYVGIQVKLERTTNTKRVPREFKIKKLEEILIQKNCINCQIAITAIGHKASAIPLHPRVLNLSPGNEISAIIGS